jgi:hypothetical protein
MSDEGKTREAKRTLKDEDIVTEKPRDIGRRDAVSLFGVVAAGAVAFATGCRRRVSTVQVVQSAITDNDGGPCADPGGGGRGYSGLTDSDGGYCSDPGGRGRTGY